MIEFANNNDNTYDITPHTVRIIFQFPQYFYIFTAVIIIIKTS